MKIQLLDGLIIALYVLTTLVIGVVMSKRARKNKAAYMLGGNTLPWYMLGLSNASGMFDISGTMWLVTLTFVYGLKSIWIPWLWPTFNQVFLMVYLSVWLRRSGVTTGAEWIGTRFGKGKGGTLSHNIVVVYALISCLGFLAYGFIGLGKFIEIFVPWEYVSAYVPFEVAPQYVAHVYGIVFTLFATFYAVIGGMNSIVWADVVQYGIMTVAAIAIGIIAMNALATETLNVPEGWLSPGFGWQLDLDWTGIIEEVNAKIYSDGFSLFTIFMMMMLFKGILVSAAGPAPNYDMQKILSTRSPKEAALMSGFVSVVLMPIRYFMIIGFAVLGLLYYEKLDLIVGGQIDFEQILPSAISNFVPVGLLGLLLAGLLAAFMSTFAGTLNAAQAYLVNDIYLKYTRPDANQRQVNRMNYLSGVVIVSVSVVIGFFAEDVNSVLQWIVSALFGSYVASNVLKWYWWRFNGRGYFWGMLSGLLAAMILPKLFPETLELYLFPAFLLISVAGCIIGTLAYPPTEEATLIQFYKNVRPWGFWGPIHEKVLVTDPDFKRNKAFGRDMFNILIGVIAQTALMVVPIYLVLSEMLPLAVSILLIVVCGYILKKNWYDHLDDEQAINN